MRTETSHTSTSVMAISARRAPSRARDQGMKSLYSRVAARPLGPRLGARYSQSCKI